MEIRSSYQVEITNLRRIFEPTVRIYRDVIAYLISVCQKRWQNIEQLPENNERDHYVEHLVHSTKSNVAEYPDFDTLFPKLPSYLRRAAIRSALGLVSSYASNHQNWVKGGRRGREPKLQPVTREMPIFYRGNMYKPSEDDENCGYLKLYVQKDWKFVKVHFRPTDIRYLKNHLSDVEASAPILEKRYHKYYLRFSFQEEVTLSSTPVSEQRICAVDLGLNTDAVCTILCADGTVSARKFIHFAGDKDRLYRALNRIKKMQRKYGCKSTKGLWNYVKRLNGELTEKIASAITEFAIQYGADVIVFEHLNFKGAKLWGSNKQKISLWRKNGIQNSVTHKAHRAGIRISRVCATNTSRLAFDGSGEVDRSRENFSLCTFPSGKHYHCDLNASLNIGARYFIREFLKPFSEREKSQFSAKVPETVRRSNCTFSTFRKLYKLMAGVQSCKAAVLC